MRRGTMIFFNFQAMFVSILLLFRGINSEKMFGLKEVFFSIITTLVFLVLLIEYLKNAFKCTEHELNTKTIYFSLLANMIFASNVADESISIVVNFSFPIAAVVVNIFFLKALFSKEEKNNTKAKNNKDRGRFSNKDRGRFSVLKK